MDEANDGYEEDADELRWFRRGQEHGRLANEVKEQQSEITSLTAEVERLRELFRRLRKNHPTQRNGYYEPCGVRQMKPARETEDLWLEVDAVIEQSREITHADKEA